MKHLGQLILVVTHALQCVAILNNFLVGSNLMEYFQRKKCSHVLMFQLQFRAKLVVNIIDYESDYGQSLPTFLLHNMTKIMLCFSFYLKNRLLFET